MEALTTTTKVTKETRTIPHPVVTRTRVAAEAVDTVVETPTATTNTKTNTIPNSTLDMVDNPTEWVTTDKA
jgi:hypothetical protein